ncbi:Glutamate racemase [compost metagenome]
MLRGWVQPLLAEGCDTLILGCTHYPFIKPLLRELLPESVSLIDTGAAVARQLQRMLGERQLLADGPAQAARFWSSAEPLRMQAVLPRLWGEPAPVRAL